MLTGKCREDFEKWYREYQNRKEDIPSLKSAMPWFYSLDFSMQYGVYVDFFDSFGYSISCFLIRQNSVLDGYEDFFDASIKRVADKDLFAKDLFPRITLYKSRTEARTKAIEKANEIYNSRTTNP